MKLCPCGSQNRYLDCCGVFLLKKAFPETPEALMRSRYTAFVENKLDYIKQTMRPPASLQLNPKEIKKSPIKWMGLTVLNSEMDPKDPHIGYVQFKAKYKSNNKEGNSIEIIHEKSEFHRIDGRWYYVDGEHYSSE